jgi:nitrate reductase delta subunit
MKTFKVLGALLAYPDAELVAALPELERALDEERLLARGARRALDGLMNELRAVELMTLQERYVDLFDRVRSLSLHLFEHVHGESRDRGQAMVDLGRLYAPAFLEFLSCRPLPEARAALTDTAHILEAVGARLAKRGSPYGAVFRALLELAGEAGAAATAVTDADIRAEDDPAALDRAWEERPAFGPGSERCGSGRQDGVSTIQFHRRTAA